ncbi:hypothetical protein RUE5091_04114 [Ruegeria denitrificans]|uniref:Uncharacterized protein n=1 Tax=Ruegeria denitrificans TaxID=1715692 RepID=A0A0P1IJK5_9RHOB|nr:hypothetical protein RUE5091_04114 [Ruegeria denitrificans]
MDAKNGTDATGKGFGIMRYLQNRLRCCSTVPRVLSLNPNFS